mgnify:CR=1 FL=1
MKKLKGLILLLLVSVTLFSGCCDENNKGEIIETSQTTSAEGNYGYEQISQEEAKGIMDTQTDYILIDARTTEEFNEGHIEGAILIPEYEIAIRAEKELPKKDKLILVYCRSGRRSKIASQILSDMGYSNVKEFGGIIDWQYEIVK